MQTLPMDGNVSLFAGGSSSAVSGIGISAGCMLKEYCAHGAEKYFLFSRRGVRLTA